MRTLPTWRHIIIYLPLIALAEFTVVYIDPQIGIFFHIIILCVLFLHSGYLSKDSMDVNKLQWLTIKDKKKPSNLFQNLINKKNTLSSTLLSLTLIPLIRVLSLVMPVSIFPRIYWFIVIGIAIYLAFFFLLYQQKISLKDCGLRFPEIRHIPLEIGIALSGIPFGYLEYYILRPSSFLESYSTENIIISILILFFATGLLEELIFRGLLQKKLTELLGVWQGILFISILFAILHIGNLSLPDVALVFCIGLLYGFVVQKTQTIIGVTVSHTLVNVFLFLILPLIGGI
jgi:membrane protease YdiL (CAAX protease family)